MQVSPINTNYRFNSNVAKTNTRNFTTNIQYSPQLTKTNNVSFGSWIIDDIYYAIRDKVSSVQYNSRKKHVDNMRKKLSEDEVALSKKLDISLPDAKKMYAIELDKARINHNWGNEKGLNRVMGYPEEKLNLIKTVVLPLTNVKAFQMKDINGRGEPLGNKIPKNLANAVPNVVLFYGPRGRGKSYMIEALMEHIDKLGCAQVKTLDRDWGVDTEKDIESIEDMVENSSPKERNVVYVKRADNLFATKNPELIEALLYHMENSAKKNGLTWIVETNDVKAVDGRIFNPKRLSQHMEIRNMEDFEQDDALSYMWADLNKKDNSDHQKIFEYARSLKIEPYPPVVRKVVDEVLKELKPANGYYDGERVSTNKMMEVIREKAEELRTITKEQKKKDGLSDQIYIERMIGRHSDEIK